MRKYKLELFSLFILVLSCNGFFFLNSLLALQRLYILDLLCKGKVHARWKFTHFSAWNYLIRSMWCLMLTSWKFPGDKVFYRALRKISCIEDKSSEKSRINMSVKGPMLWNARFWRPETPIIARSCSGFRWVAVAVTEYWSFKSGNWI